MWRDGRGNDDFEGDGEMLCSEARLRTERDERDGGDHVVEERDWTTADVIRPCIRTRREEEVVTGNGVKVGR